MIHEPCWCSHEREDHDKDSGCYLCRCICFEADTGPDQ